MNRTDDGTEYRDCEVRVREGGLRLLVEALTGKNGFCRSGMARVTMLDDGRLYVQVPSNAGKADGYAFLGLDFFIDVKELLPRKEESKERQDGDQKVEEKQEVVPEGRDAAGAGRAGDAGQPA